VRLVAAILATASLKSDFKGTLKVTSATLHTSCSTTSVYGIGENARRSLSAAITSGKLGS
jgi:hypothetical protein